MVHSFIQFMSSDLALAELAYGNMENTSIYLQVYFTCSCSSALTGQTHVSHDVYKNPDM